VDPVDKDSPENDQSWTLDLLLVKIERCILRLSGFRDMDMGWRDWELERAGWEQLKENAIEDFGPHAAFDVLSGAYESLLSKLSIHEDKHSIYTNGERVNPTNGNLVDGPKDHPSAIEPVEVYGDKVIMTEEIPTTYPVEKCNDYVFPPNSTSAHLIERAVILIEQTGPLAVLYRLPRHPKPPDIATPSPYLRPAPVPPDIEGPSPHLPHDPNPPDIRLVAQTSLPPDPKPPYIAIPSSPALPRQPKPPDIASSTTRALRPEPKPPTSPPLYLPPSRPRRILLLAGLNPSTSPPRARTTWLRSLLARGIRLELRFAFRTVRQNY
jgi:hypothetical protein